jgi:hypothetical protein
MTKRGKSDAGKSYVVFGKTNNTAINLSDIASGTGGFVINGENAGDDSGFSVSTAGDVNGDGLDDLIIGARYADLSNKLDAGKSYHILAINNNAPCATGNSRKVNCCAVFFAEDDIGFSCFYFTI